MVERLKEALPPLAASYRVRLAYVFGSAATSRANDRRATSTSASCCATTRPQSEPQAEAMIERFRAPLAKAAGVAADRLDLVCLNFLPVTVAFRVIRDDVRVYEAGPYEHSRYAGRIASEYQDFRHYELAYANRALREIGEKGFAR